MKLEKLSYTKGSRNHKEKRVGRGFGSGIGKTSTRGSKGQNARKSGGTRLGFEGGQTTLYRRIPKVGFNNANFANNYNVVTLTKIANLSFSNITPKTLVEHNIIPENKLPLKIIGKTDLKKSITISAHKFSKGAQAILEKSNSKITFLK
ncbi:MAG: 50S ribosomal protein L15 [Malacoplasma sp.]|nr:50S ribosomal protein L15 [Malacoplasma sp.]